MSPGGQLVLPRGWKKDGCNKCTSEEETHPSTTLAQARLTLGEGGGQHKDFKEVARPGITLTQARLTSEF